MSSDEKLSPQVGQFSNEMTQRVSLRDLRLSYISAKLYSAAPAEPVKTNAVLQNTEFEYDDGLALYNLTYHFATEDTVGEKVWDLSFTFNLSFEDQNKSLGVPSDELLSAFGRVGVVDIAHPYARELVHQITLRMNVPALVLEVQPLLSQLPPIMKS